MSELIDHKALAISRLATQFREATNLIAYIKALLLEADTLESVFQDLLTKRWIDTAEGVNLDILGSIVGQPRILVDAALLFYFGFATDPSAQSFGSVNDPSVGGRFKAIDEPVTGNRELTDDEYRIFIKARVIKNYVTPTVNELTAFFKFLFEVDQVIIVDIQTMQYSVQIGRILTPNEIAFLNSTDLVPKVAAVGVTYIEYDVANVFAFGGVINSKGFGSVNDASLGGKFGNII